MENIIYVKLLEEGTEVFRPVLAMKVRENVYRLGGEDTYDPQMSFGNSVLGV